MGALTIYLCRHAREQAGYNPEPVNTPRAQGIKATAFPGGNLPCARPEQALCLVAEPVPGPRWSPHPGDHG